MFLNQKIKIQPPIIFPIENIKIPKLWTLLQTDILIKKYHFILFANLIICAINFTIDLKLYNLSEILDGYILRYMKSEK